MNGKEIKWQDPPKGDFWTDVKMYVLWQDKKTGANLTLLRAPKSDKAVMGPHAHPNANEWSVYLAGEGETPDGTRIKASADNIVFGFVPKGEIHAKESGKVIQELTWIRYHDGPSTRVNK